MCVLLPVGTYLSFFFLHFHVRMYIHTYECRMCSKCDVCLCLYWFLWEFPLRAQADTYIPSYCPCLYMCIYMRTYICTYVRTCMYCTYFMYRCIISSTSILQCVHMYIHTYVRMLVYEWLLLRWQYVSVCLSFPNTVCPHLFTTSVPHTMCQINQVLDKPG